MSHLPAVETDRQPIGEHQERTKTASQIKKASRVEQEHLPVMIWLPNDIVVELSCMTGKLDGG